MGKHSRYRALISAGVGLCLVLALALGAGQPRVLAATQPSATAAQQASRGQQPGNGTSFQDLNGFLWFYNTYFNYKYSDIEKQLPELKHDGFRVLGFFSPYDGNVNLCDGCDPANFFTVSPQNGTLKDWDNLVKAAHREGMKVVAYFVNIYMDANSPYFIKAQQEYAAGDRTSAEVASFDWSTTPNAPLPSLVSGPPSESSWTWSPIAHAYYWKLWFGPGFDFQLAGNRAEVAKIEEFWLSTGLDGFMWDVGRTNPLIQPFDVTIPETYTTTDKWLAGERNDSSTAATNQSFGFTDWFNYQDNNTENDYTRIVDGSIDANGLETALENNDYAREHGDTTHAWSIWGDDPTTNLIPHTYPTYPNDDLERVQEAALLAGAGVLYGSAMYDQYIRWSPTLRANWDRVLQTVNANPALLPSASRTRVPAGSDPEVYAMRRTSTDGKQTALLIYNFHSTPENVTVDLTGTGINTHQVPKDLYNGGHGPAIDGTSYTVSLPAYGFSMLRVSTNQLPTSPLSTRLP
jgi:Alpha amylase, catalytic domain